MLLSTLYVVQLCAESCASIGWELVDKQQYVETLTAGFVRKWGRS